MFSDPEEPFPDEPACEFGLLVEKGMSRAIEHGQRGTGIVFEQLPLAGVSGGGILAPEKDERWMPVGRGGFRAFPELPLREDSHETLFINECAGGEHVLLVSAQRFSGLHDEVVPIVGFKVRIERVREVGRNKDLMCRNILSALAHRTYQRQPDYLVGSSIRNRAGKVPPV